MRCVHNSKKETVKTKQYSPLSLPSMGRGASRRRENHSTQGEQSRGTDIIENSYYPDHTSVASRIDSFYQLDALKQAPDDLAKAGFLCTKYPNAVFCFAEGHGISEIEVTDDPFEKHVKFYKTCRYVNTEEFKHHWQLYRQNRETRNH
ncbi:MAG: hypothetical protein KAG53_03720 [Endozoicomonadaceae bacterium]|nr:hypothetical protein [Endozoicomonadaceae bacterium]